MRRSAVWLIVVALALTACNDAPPEDGVADASVDDPSTEVEVTDEPAAADDEPAADEANEITAPCRHDGLEDQPFVTVAGGDPVELGREVAARTHRCAAVAVVAPAGGWEATLAVPVALAADAPLLLVDPASPDAVVPVLDELDVDEVVTVGMPLDGLGRPGTELLAAPSGDDGGTTGASTADADRAGDEDDAVAADDEDVEVGDDDPDVDPDVDPDAAGTRNDGPGDADAAAVLPLALQVADHLGVQRFLAVPPGDHHARLAAAQHTDGSTAVLPVPADQAALIALAESLPTSAQVTVVASDDPDQLAGDLVAVGVNAEADGDEPWPVDAAATSWLVDPAQTDAAALTAVAAGGRDEALLPIVGADLRAGDDARRVREAAPERAVLVGDVTADADWQLAAVRDGATLPGGGHRLFEDERMVAIYGHPGSTVLGALGEQDLDGAVERARQVAEPYGADGAAILPAFEIITTIASAEAGTRGDYSRRTDPEVLRPWIDRAAEEGFYVVLDLQPGRTDFLEQAQEYEELLLEPHVGLALDPEWRLEDDQVHLRQIGSVAAEEVQRVVDWLAELTREHRLPQKLLVLHQFRFSMLPDRDTIEPRPELAVVVHMDGQGPLETKYETYAAITAGAQDRWVWGWKNFYDEDQPTATPEQVLALDPLPWFVSYQ
jgi:hypothetical protein